MKGIIVFLSGQVFVGSLKGFGGGWVGSEKSFRQKDWETRTENWTTPNQGSRDGLAWRYVRMYQPGMAHQLRDEPLIIVGGGSGIIEKKKRKWSWPQEKIKTSALLSKKKKSKCLVAEEKKSKCLIADEKKSKWKKSKCLVPEEKKASALLPRKKKKQVPLSRGKKKQVQNPCPTPLRWLMVRP